MPKATKKSAQKTAKKTPPAVMPVESLDLNSVPVTTPVTITQAQTSRFLRLALVVVLVGLLTYKFGPWLVPALVDNSPVFRMGLWSRLEKSYGAQALDDMINEKILDNAIAKSGVKVDQAKLDDQIKLLETQFESTGGLDEALVQRGLTRDDLIRQVKTQLAVEELLADKINPTEEEIKAYFESNATTLYKDKTLEEVQGSIAEELTQTKLRDEFLVWFADIKKTANIRTFGL